MLLTDFETRLEWHRAICEGWPGGTSGVPRAGGTGHTPYPGVGGAAGNHRTSRSSNQALNVFRTPPLRTRPVAPTFPLLMEKGAVGW